MKIIKNLLILSLTILFIGSATKASAITLTYETLSGDGGPGAGILYSLTYDQQATPYTYFATFTITTPGGSFDTDWWAGWFTFKFVEGNNAATLYLKTVPENTGGWTAIPPPANVFGGTNIGQGGRSGFYVSSLLNNSGNVSGFPYNEMVLLTEPQSVIYTFTFEFSTLLSVFTDEIPFQVGYYDGATGSEKVIANRLSQTLAVPEPSTLLLLGAGLLGLGVLGRKFRTKP